MRIATIAVILVALLSTQMACSSPKYTWHTVEPDALDSLTASSEEASEGSTSPGGEVVVDCAAQNKDRDGSEPRWQPPCEQIAVTGQHRLRLYRQYQEPLNVRLSQLATDDDHIYTIVARRYDPTLTEVANKDDIAAVRIREVHDRSVSSSLLFLGGAAGFLTTLSAVIATVYLLR